MKKANKNVFFLFLPTEEACLQFLNKQKKHSSDMDS